MVKYRIYPSIIDSFSWYKKNESHDALQQFIDRVNRVKQPYSEAADKGTKFNEVIDSLLTGKLPNGVYLSTDKSNYIYPANGEAPEFKFNANICHEFAYELKSSMTQVLVDGILNTQYGSVQLYGYADNVIMDTVVDIKTIYKAYEFPKFLHNWQHIVYPYCLRQQGISIERFSYLITDFNVVNNEDYEYNEEKDLPRLIVQVESMIEFLESQRELITDLKIFNLLPETV